MDETMSTLKTMKPIAPAYAPFPSLDRYIDYVVQNGVPEIVDTNVLTELGESVRAHLLTGLRYLGMVAADRRPTELLRRFAQATEYERKMLYQEVLINSYAFILDEFPELRGLTHDILVSKFESLGIQGSTVKKCISFFLELSRQVGWQMEKNEKLQRTGNREQVSKWTVTPTARHEGEIKTISLKSAGSLTLALNVNLLELRGEDRTFVFSLIDQLQDYEDKTQKATG
ncbi:MAG: DUF5343 domain-containing protein [Acidobacteria bacterium]|nr:DUF5343 domain-containing protein [Acidobacteriota bacterium]